MNIFYTSPDPIQCAQALDDSRVIKMTLETAQLLSTAVFHIAPAEHARLALYRPTHGNHPCALWVRQGTGNFAWLLRHGQALASEYTLRFHRPHASLSIINSCSWASLPMLPQRLTTSPPPNCTPYKSLPILQAYRQTLLNKWLADKRPPKWTYPAIRLQWTKEELYADA